ncbi:hypothetical protein OG21DRAFT_1528282, partial [Imleria badia]
LEAFHHNDTVIHYLGLCGFITLVLSLAGPSFLPGPENLCKQLPLLHPMLTQIKTLQAWYFKSLVHGSWGLFARPIIILGVLLTSYVMEVIPSIVDCIIYSVPRNIPVTLTHILDYSFCTLEPRSLSWNKATSITQLVHGAVMCMLVITQFTTQSLSMYKATKLWRPNQYMNLIVREGVLYFLAYESSFHLSSPSCPFCSIYTIARQTG